MTTDVHDRRAETSERQDFVSSVSTLLTIRQGTVHLRRRIGELDGQMGDVGRSLGEKVGQRADYRQI